MRNLLSRVTDPEKREQGFTLIELLVVIIIIGILAAIAIPIFLNQKKKAADATAKSDLRNAISVVEATFTDNPNVVVGGPATNKSAASKYTLQDNQATPAAITGADVVTSNGVTMNVAGGQSGYCIATRATNGTTTYWYDSTTGQTTNGAQTTTAGSPCLAAKITAP